MSAMVLISRSSVDHVAFGAAPGGPKQAQATVYLLVDDFDRADAEETSES